MDEKTLKALQQQLLQLQHELTTPDPANDDASKPVELDQQSVGRVSRMDAMQGQAMALELKRRRQLQQGKVLAALHRIEEGDYGYCLECDEEIDPRRLAFDPATPLCLHCAEKKES